MRGGLGQESSGEKRGLQKTSRLGIPVTCSEKLEIYKNESGCRLEAAERQERGEGL